MASFTLVTLMLLTLLATLALAQAPGSALASSLTKSPSPTSSPPSYAPAPTSKPPTPSLAPTPSTTPSSPSSALSTSPPAPPPLITPTPSNALTSLKKIASLKLDKKILLVNLFDATELLNDVKNETMLLLEKVKNLEHELSIVREQTDRSASSKLDHMLSVQKSLSDKTDLGLNDFPAFEPVHIIAPISATFLRQRVAQMRESSKRPQVKPSGTAHPPSSTGTTSGEASADPVGATVVFVPPPSTSDDFDIRRTLETVMTVQAAHGTRESLERSRRLVLHHGEFEK
ncbi:pollen-specific leucine-rich repeat extensin-like protein 2 [Quercus robur]|uniref:pollen-specific leucine-rich repeat extensin-like protein 2 n=1 Tax=Quercus robur TaxID=38942 RepID=UPI0021623C12|nr:pollen-specific leucine-rich repeat extensin-like protein 2 [Quercus robur]